MELKWMSAKKTKSRKAKKPKIEIDDELELDIADFEEEPIEYDDDSLAEDIEELAKGIFIGAEEAIEEAKKLNCDTKEAELYLEKGRTQFEMGNFEYADNYCQLALSSAKTASKKHRAEEMFHETAKMIKDNATIYTNIHLIEDGYREAEELFEAGNYDDAILSLETVKNEAIDLIFENIIRDSELKLQQLAEKIREYRRKKIDVEEPSLLLGKANNAFDNGDYLKANEMADEALQILNIYVEQEFKEPAAEIMVKIKKLKTSKKIDKEALTGISPTINNIEEAYKNGQYQMVIELDSELTEYTVNSESNSMTIWY
jgi:tetratricopeptide (TPR) repeat protein